jgi:dynein heavy chain
MPDGGKNVHEYLIEDQRWITWKERLQRESNAAALNSDSGLMACCKMAFVPTTESLKISSTIELCLAHKLPLLLVGPTGTGKSVSVQQVLRDAPKDTNTVIQITFSAKSTTN